MLQSIASVIQAMPVEQEIPAVEVSMTSFHSGRISLGTGHHKPNQREHICGIEDCA